MITMASRGDLDRWVADTVARVDLDRLAELVMGLVDIPSATGQEIEAATWLAGQLARSGAKATVQPLEPPQANAHGRLEGDGSGPDLLLYAPIDTLTTGDPDEDLPWIGPSWRDDFGPHAERHGDLVRGLGASNPKGHAACVIAAFEAVAASGIPLAGDLIAGFGAGGMPTNSLPGNPNHHTGQGVGCSFLLEQGVWPDAAVIAKPGWAVSWEEVGLAWFDIWVEGIHTYVGSRHRLPYRNPIVDAAEVMVRLERWFETYSDQHENGLVRPQGVIGSVDGGWTRMASVTPAACRFRVDLRLDPRTSPAVARRELRGALRGIAAELPGVQFRVEAVLAIPGTSTPREHWIVGAAVEAWEAVAGRAHEEAGGTSGATDANILRSRGVPTARVGMPKVAEAPWPIDFQAGMNTVDLVEMSRLTEVLIRCALNVCTRPTASIPGPG
jgi:acetylornithine deacetylase/succinyl-diaminopimelate desuccinylase-like protein